jgi:hypothetical protein
LELIGLRRRFGSVVALDGLTLRGLIPPSASLSRRLVSRQSDVGTVILPAQIPLILAYALSYTVI